MSFEVQPQGAPCPVCQTPTELLDVVDFNKNCMESEGLYLKLAGYPVYYVRCPQCRFAFAPQMWAWDPDAFKTYVYNDDYGIVDPEYLEIRPDDSASIVLKLFPEAPGLTHLDYGGGNGRLSLRLNEAGLKSQSYEPMATGFDSRPSGPFDLVTAFEVFEHVPSVDRLMQDLDALTHDESVVLFSTQVSDGRIAEEGRLTWWYASPRNGHISLYSRDSLKRLAIRHGFGFASISENYHLFCRPTVPRWAQSLIRPG